MNRKKFFSPNFMSEFKKWMHENDDSKVVFSKGQRVQSNCKLKQIVEKIDCVDTGDHTVFEVSKYFLKHGGVIKECNGDQITIKNKKGTFILNQSDIVAD